MLATAVQRFREAQRLILFATLLSFAAGVMTFLRYDLVVHGMPLPLFTGLLYAGFVGTAAAVTSIVLPALRAMIEAAAISRFGVALAAFGLPEFGAAIQQSPLFSATLIVAGAIAIRKLLATGRFARLSVGAA